MKRAIGDMEVGVAFRRNAHFLYSGAALTVLFPGENAAHIDGLDDAV